MQKIIPKKLRHGSHIRIIAPSRSMSIISEEDINFAKARLEELGFKISFGKHVKEKDCFNSSSIKARIVDLHDAFSDKNVDAILSVIGGYNANQLLNYINYDLIRENPKILCGFSDITVLNNAITKKTGLITYSGPHFSSWAMKKGFDYSKEYFIKACVESTPFNIFPSDLWSDDIWYIDQEKRDFIDNEGYWIINKGSAKGKIVGGHVRCLAALQGTEYWPDLNNSILFLEEDEEGSVEIFDRLLQSLVHQADFNNVLGIVIGRFQKKTKMTTNLLREILSSKTELKKIPVIANVNFGHTVPIFTFPIGGECELEVGSDVRLYITSH